MKTILLIFPLLFFTENLIAQEFFPKAIYFDPYTIAFDEDDFGEFQPADSNYYAIQMADCGVNLAVTLSDNPNHVQALFDHDIRLLDMLFGEPAQWMWDGYQEIWPLGAGFDDDGNWHIDHHLNGSSYTLTPLVEGQIADYFREDEFDGSDWIIRYVIVSREDEHNAGVIFDGSQLEITAGDWINPNLFRLIVHAKIDTTGCNISGIDTVFTVRVYEGSRDCKFAQYFDDQSISGKLAMGRSPSNHRISPNRIERHNHNISFTVADFETNLEYHSVVSDTFMLNANPVTRVDVEWRGLVDLYLDGYELRSERNYNLLISPDTNYYRTIVKDSIAQRHTVVGDNSDAIFRWYFDEPCYNMYNSIGMINQLSADTTGVGMICGTPGAHYSTIQQYQYYDFVNSDYLIYHWYPISGETSSSWTSHNSDDAAGYGNRTVQEAWDVVTDKLTIVSTGRPGFPEPDIPLIYIAQVQSEKLLTMEERFRNPLPQEISAQVWLALAHDATGIMYFIYGTFVSPWGNIQFHGMVDIDANANGIADDTNIYDPSLGPYVPNYKYYTVQEINRKIDLIADIILELQWSNSYTDNEPISELMPSQYSCVVNIQSNDFNEPYIEIANFNHPNGEKYFMLINRRVCTDSSNVVYNLGYECPGDETQTIIITLEESSVTRMVEDILAINDPEDVAHQQHLVDPGENFTLTIAPGEGRLFRIVEDVLRGDVNRSGYLNVSDIIMIIEFILAADFPDNYEFWAADLNQSETITITDAIILIGLILE